MRLIYNLVLKKLKQSDNKSLIKEVPFSEVVWDFYQAYFLASIFNKKATLPDDFDEMFYRLLTNPDSEVEAYFQQRIRHDRLVINRFVDDFLRVTRDETHYTAPYKKGCVAILDYQWAELEEAYGYEE